MNGGAGNGGAGEAGASTVTIREARADDVASITAIERASFGDPWRAEAFRDLLGRDEVTFLVAERPLEGRPDDASADTAVLVGFVIVYGADGAGDLANIAVDPRARGGGVGRRLLRAARETARRRGIVELFLEVRASNVVAQSLYRTEGFVEVGRRSKYYVRPAEDALILRLAPV